MKPTVAPPTNKGIVRGRGSPRARGSQRGRGSLGGGSFSASVPEKAAAAHVSPKEPDDTPDTSDVAPDMATTEDVKTNEVSDTSDTLDLSTEPLEVSVISAEQDTGSVGSEPVKPEPVKEVIATKLVETENPVPAAENTKQSDVDESKDMSLAGSDDEELNGHNWILNDILVIDSEDGMDESVDKVHDDAVTMVPKSGSYVTVVGQAAASDDDMVEFMKSLGLKGAIGFLELSIAGGLPLHIVAAETRSVRMQRRVVVHGVSPSDLSCTSFLSLIDSAKCNYLKLECSRQLHNTTIWTGDLEIYFGSADLAKSAIETLGQLREGITVDYNTVPPVTAEPKPQTATDNSKVLEDEMKPWIDLIVIVKNIGTANESCKSKLAELFPDADIVVHKDSTNELIKGQAYLIFASKEMANNAVKVFRSLQFRLEGRRLILIRWHPSKMLPDGMLRVGERRMVMLTMLQMEAKLAKGGMPLLAAKYKALGEIVARDTKTRHACGFPAPSYNQLKGLHDVRHYTDAEQALILRRLLTPFNCAGPDEMTNSSMPSKPSPAAARPSLPPQPAQSPAPTSAGKQQIKEPVTAVPTASSTPGDKDKGQKSSSDNDSSNSCKPTVEPKVATKSTDKVSLPPKASGAALKKPEMGSATELVKKARQIVMRSGEKKFRPPKAMRVAGRGTKPISLLQLKVQPLSKPGPGLLGRSPASLRPTPVLRAAVEPLHAPPVPSGGGSGNGLLPLPLVPRLPGQTRRSPVRSPARGSQREGLQGLLGSYPGDREPDSGSVRPLLSDLDSEPKRKLARYSSNDDSDVGRRWNDRTQIDYRQYDEDKAGYYPPVSREGPEMITRIDERGKLERVSIRPQTSGSSTVVRSIFDIEGPGMLMGRTAEVRTPEPYRRDEVREMRYGDQAELRPLPRREQEPVRKGRQPEPARREPELPPEKMLYREWDEDRGSDGRTTRRGDRSDSYSRDERRQVPPAASATVGRSGMGIPSLLDMVGLDVAKPSDTHSSRVRYGEAMPEERQRTGGAEAWEPVRQRSGGQFGEQRVGSQYGEANRQRPGGQFGEPERQRSRDQFDEFDYQRSGNQFAEPDRHRSGGQFGEVEQYRRPAGNFGDPEFRRLSATRDDSPSVNKPRSHEEPRKYVDYGDSLRGRTTSSSIMPTEVARAVSYGGRNEWSGVTDNRRYEAAEARGVEAPAKQDPVSLLLNLSQLLADKLQRDKEKDKNQHRGNF